MGIPSKSSEEHQKYRSIMFDEDKILSDLKALLGKEFYLLNFVNLTNIILMSLQSTSLCWMKKKNQFFSNQKGGIRLVHVLGESPNETKYKMLNITFQKT